MHSFVFLAHINGLWWPSCAGAAGDNAAKNWLDTGPILTELLSAGGQSPIHDITEWRDSLPTLCFAYYRLHPAPTSVTEVNTP